MRDFRANNCRFVQALYVFCGSFQLRQDPSQGWNSLISNKMRVLGQLSSVMQNLVSSVANFGGKAADLELSNYQGVAIYSLRPRFWLR